MICQASIKKEQLVNFLQERKENLQDQINTCKAHYQQYIFDGFNEAVEFQNDKRNQNLWNKIFIKEKPPLEDSSVFNYDHYSFDDFIYEYHRCGEWDRYGMYLTSRWFPFEKYKKIKSVTDIIYKNSSKISLIQKVLNLCEQTDSDFVVIDQELWDSVK